MSRSRRKPYAVDGMTSRGGSGTPSRKALAKRDANRAVRQANKKAIRDESEELADGSAFKRASCSWNIADFKFYSPKTPKMWRK